MQVLVVLGCSEEAFVGLLHRYTCQPAKGPIDASVKDVLAALLELDDFQTFATAMRDR